MLKTGIFGGIAFLIGEMCYKALKLIISAVLGTIMLAIAIGVFFLLVKGGYLIL